MECHLVPKQPVLAVASYSALLLASIEAFGANAAPLTPPSQMAAKRQAPLLPGSDYAPPERNGRAPEQLAPFDFTSTPQGLVQAAAA